VAVLTAVAIVLAVLVAIDLLLTVGIVRRLRDGEGLGTGKPVVQPARGHRIDLSRDAKAWPDGAAQLLTGTALVAMVVPGCSTCERLHRAIDELKPLPVPFVVIGQPEFDGLEVTQAYLSGWHDAIPLLAPLPYEDLESFGRPGAYPVVMMVENGKVTASGNRLHEVTAAMYSAADRLDAVSNQR